MPAVLVAIVGLCGACAEGQPLPADFAAESLPAAMQMPTDGTDPLGTPDAGTGAPAAPVFAGEACMMGDTMPCTCADGGEGTKACLNEPASPTNGAYGECSNCVAPMVPVDTGMDPGTGAAGAAAPPPTMTPACDVNACPTPAAPIPFLPAPMKCCTAAGTCGAVDLTGACA